MDHLATMSPYRKGALLVVRLVAFALVLVPGLLVISDFFDSKLHHGSGSNVFSLAWKGALFIAGTMLLIKSDAIAKKLTEDLDD